MPKDTTPRNKQGRLATRVASKRSQRKPTIKQRAQSIIDSEAYDEYTRKSIRHQLKTNYSGLADMVERAEQGETICDLYRVEAEYKKAARQVIVLFNHIKAPAFLTNAMMDAFKKPHKSRA